MDNLENIYIKNEDNMPLKTTVLLIRKILILKQILEIDPNINFKYDIENLSNIPGEFKWRKEIKSFPKPKDQTILNLLDNLISIDNEFSNFLIKNSINSTKDSNYFQDNIKNFTFNDKIMNINSFKDIVKKDLSYIVDNCKQKVNYNLFIDCLLNNKEYIAENISLYGFEIPMIPTTIEDTYNHKYEEWSILKDDF